jgi:hypothetical protein
MQGFLLFSNRAPFFNKKAYLNRGVQSKLQLFPHASRILHATPGGFPSHVSYTKEEL